MAASEPTHPEPLRMTAPDVKARLDAGEPATILDVRGQQAWEGSSVKIRGAVRVSPADFRVDPAWPRDRLTVAYCT
jgi:hypothetical protein